MPNTTKIVNFIPARGEEYSIQHYYVIKFVGDRLVDFAGYSSFFHQQNQQPLYNWIITECVIKHT